MAAPLVSQFPVKPFSPAATRGLSHPVYAHALLDAAGLHARAGDPATARNNWHSHRIKIGTAAAYVTGRRC